MRDKEMQKPQAQIKKTYIRDDELLLRLRREIDGIDDEIFTLLEKRMGLVNDIGRHKKKSGSAIYRPEREREILERLGKKGSQFLSDKAISAIFKEIFGIARNLELPEKVAFLGPIGSYTQEAANALFGEMSEYVALNNITSIFKSLEQKRVKYGVVPIENNTNGMVGATIDNLACSELKIIAEMVLPIHHCLASRAEHLSKITKIYSKDIAFGQCGDFLKSHSLDDLALIPVDSTAKAAQLASNDATSAAICSKVATKLYNLPVMFENIEDSSNNKTRFVVVSDFVNNPSGNDKTSVFATLQNYKQSAALLALLEDFKHFGINITKIDSRPIRSKSDVFAFGFYLDFKGHYLDDNIKALFAKRAKELKWLGSYVSSYDFLGVKND